MMRRSLSLLAMVLVTDLATSISVKSAESPPTAADLKRLEGELARVQQQVNEQRQLIFQLMQMHDALLKYLQSGGGANAGAPLGGFPGAVEPAAAPAAAGRREAASAPAPASGAAPSAGAETGSVTGQASVNGAAPSEAYVYVDGLRSAPSHPPSLEIKQQNRRFVPAVAVVPVGSHVLFPNQDTVFHSVFSNTPGDAFDVGTLKAGQTPAPVALLKPGHVEVFCNIHSKMRADVLVVPNGHWVRVRPDGSFSLPGVPTGKRHLVLWGPALKPVSQQVDVKAGGATATFSTEARVPPPHLNKNGAAYGSYEN